MPSLQIKLDTIVEKLEGIFEQVRPLPDASELVGAQACTQLGRSLELQRA